MAIATFTEASEILGYRSRSTLYALKKVGCQSAGQSNKKGDRSRYWTKPEANSDQLIKPESVSSSKSESEQSLIDF